MPIERKFLGFNQPALWSAAEWLIERSTTGKTANLENTIAVLPGGRAGRRLLEILVEVAERRGVMLSPPEIETVGRLPEQLYPLKRPLASDLTQQLAWANILRKADRTSLSAFLPAPPDADDSAGWLALGELLRQQHTELAADGFDFSDVVKQGKKLDGFGEEPRWRTLAQLQQDYLRLLDGLELWDVQTARLEAIKRKECHSDRTIVLIGTVDMNDALRQMLDQVAKRSSASIFALIFAPESWGDRFDGHGCLLPDVWNEIEIPLLTEQVQLAEGPSDQADAVLRHVASYNGKYRADEITVGVPDEKLVATLQRRFDEFEVPSRFGPGSSIASTGPYALLEVIAGYLDDRRFAGLASLVRHSDFYEWMTSQLGESDWLTALDTYQAEHLPVELADDRDWLGESGRLERVRAVHQCVHTLLADLHAAPQPLGEWTKAIAGLMMRIYGDRPLNRHVEAERRTLESCERLLGKLQSHATVPTALSPTVTASQAIRFALDYAANETIPEAANAAAIEMLGWLELPLDDAPALIVTSLNEGFVPKSLNSDLFLPNALRSHLKLEDNARRFARDAYSLSALVASRRDLKLIVGRRNSDNDPMVPSRLLFAADAETVAKRVLAFFEPPRDQSPERLMPKALTPRKGNADFPIPMPIKRKQSFETLSVTAFRAYIACPYRFYLAYVQGLECMRDDGEELDGGAFGNLLHEVMKRFGGSAMRDSADPEEIRKVLHRELGDAAVSAYGRRPLPAVAIQLEQLRVRLDAFAERQAAWVAEGWRIKHVEVPEYRSPIVTLDVDGTPVKITGRIDRIDHRPATGEWAILDYKSSDAGLPPDKTHIHSNEWIDLQLPLYRHFVRKKERPTGTIHLGYIVLPKDTSQVKFVLAEWSEAELAAADEVAKDVIRRIRQQEFWPPTDPPPAFAEDFAAICQDGVFDKWRPEKT